MLMKGTYVYKWTEMPEEKQRNYRKAGKKQDRRP